MHQPVPGLGADDARQHEQRDACGDRRDAAPQHRAQCDGQGRGESEQESGADDDPGQGGPALGEDVAPVGGQDVPGHHFADRGCDDAGGKASDPATMALAASTPPRRGLAAKVVRISPRRYSEVAKRVASTVTISSATIVPLTMLAPAHWAEMMSPTSGAMSPDPLTVSARADGCCQLQPTRWGRRRQNCRRGQRLRSRSGGESHPGQRPRRNWQRPGWGPRQAPAAKYTGEVTNRPIWIMRGRPASRAVPTSVQRAPSAES